MLLGDRAQGWMVDTGDGGSPGGSSAEELWAVGEDPAAPCLCSAQLGSSSTMGLGAGDDGEGYVVGVSRRRAFLEVTSPGHARVRRIETWGGNHARATDRWSGSFAAETPGPALSMLVLMPNSIPF